MIKSLFLTIVGLLLINTFLIAQQNECDWDVYGEIVCHPDTGACGTKIYEVIFVWEGEFPDSLLIVNNLAQDTIGINAETPVYVSEELPIFTGYDFTFFDANNLSCFKNVSSELVVCQNFGSGSFLDAKEDEVMTEINKAVVIDVINNDAPAYLYNDDIESICVSDVTPFSQSGGTVEINDDCTITYTPPLDFTGYDYFVYNVISEFRYFDFEAISSAEVEVFVRDIDFDSLYVQEEVICNPESDFLERSYIVNFYLPYFNDNYFWRFCGESDWQFLGDFINEQDSILSFEFDLYENPEYCLEFVDFNHPDNIFVAEKNGIDCEYPHCCFQNFDVFYEINCDADSIHMIFNLAQVAATQTYEWRNCWSDTWNETSVPEGQNVSEPFIISDEIDSDVCVEFRNVGCNDHYFAIWEENVNCKSLSIELFSINGMAKNNYNEINWTTASEANNAHFILERSEDGQHFTPLTKVSGQGNSNSVKKYFYNDFINEEKGYYYRLSSVDFDGKRKRVSKVIFIKRDRKPIKLSVFPNPTSEYLQVLFPDSIKENIHWQISDIHGRKVSEGFTEGGMNHLKIEVEHLLNGTYFLKIDAGGEQNQFVERFNVLK